MGYISDTTNNHESYIYGVSRFWGLPTLTHTLHRAGPEYVLLHGEHLVIRTWGFELVSLNPLPVGAAIRLKDEEPENTVASEHDVFGQDPGDWIAWKKKGRMQQIFFKCYPAQPPR